MVRFLTLRISILGYFFGYLSVNVGLEFFFTPCAHTYQEINFA
jgi:hypothetical protein